MIRVRSDVADMVTTVSIISHYCVMVGVKMRISM